MKLSRMNNKIGASKTIYFYVNFLIVRFCFILLSHPFFKNIHNLLIISLHMHDIVFYCIFGCNGCSRIVEKLKINVQFLLITETFIQMREKLKRQIYIFNNYKYNQIASKQRGPIVVIVAKTKSSNILPVQL